jgi:Tol biopolymer transport system component
VVQALTDAGAQNRDPTWTSDGRFVLFSSDRSGAFQIYAVEVDNGDGTTRLVAVDPGLYADGLVEVTADGLRPGDRVVAP